MHSEDFIKQPQNTSYDTKIIIILSFIVTKFSGTLCFDSILWKVMFKSFYTYDGAKFCFHIAWAFNYDWLASHTTPGQHKMMLHNKTSEWFEIWCQNSTQIWIRLNLKNTCFIRKHNSKYWNNSLVGHDITLYSVCH